MTRRRLARVLAPLAALSAVAVALADRLVTTTARAPIVDPAAAPDAPVAIVPGAGVRPDGSLSAVLEDRLFVAAALYHQGSVRKLLVSGDHGRKEYDEPGAMARDLERRGVPARDVFLDHAGFDTYATVHRARSVFGVTEALIVTQEFHLPRALFFAEKLGVHATGVRADRRRYERRHYFAAREVGARLRGLALVAIGARPRFLGAPVPIDGDGRVTRDKS